MAQLMTNFWRKTLIINAKTPKFAPARVRQIMTDFWRKTLILNTKTPKFAPARVAQIVTNFGPVTLICNAKTPKFAPALDNEKYSLSFGRTYAGIWCRIFGRNWKSYWWKSNVNIQRKFVTVLVLNLGMVKIWQKTKLIFKFPH